MTIKMFILTIKFGSKMFSNSKGLTGAYRSQPVFSGKPEEPFCLCCTFIFRNERNWTKKSARLSEKTGKPGITRFT